ncbi:MAG: hypothetical protein NTW49_09130 [Bacteroidia bacterium]|nr:hypothetical protein [Bacteroidia bacterium]
MKPGLIKILFIICSIALSDFFVSCDKAWVDCDTYNFSDCNEVEPVVGEMKIHLTINAENDSVPLVVYYGNFEDRDTAYADIVRADTVTYSLPVNHRYSVTAEYTSGDKHITAVDGVEMKKKSSEVCKATCWKVTGNEMDVTLHYK